MLAEDIQAVPPDSAMRACIQKVATGPEYSKDLSFDEARRAMQLILDNAVDPVQSGVYLIALRMKRETDAENRGTLQALLDASDIVTAPVDEVVDIADLYDGYTRALPASPFLPAVLAACGVPAITHGVESVGPKYGATTRKVLRAAGAPVDLSPAQAAACLGRSEPGWAYLDQRAFCPRLHDLIALRARIVKRPVLTTVENLLGPIRGRRKTHLVTGYVHKAYPSVYASLARHAGFASAAIVRGVEGGVVPSLQQPAGLTYYHDGGAEQTLDITPQSIGIDQNTRAVPIPGDLAGGDAGGAPDPNADRIASAAAERGLAALQGEAGATRDSMVYGGALVLFHLRHHGSLAAAAEAVRGALDSGRARAHFEAGLR